MGDVKVVVTIIEEGKSENHFYDVDRQQADALVELLNTMIPERQD